MRRYEANPAMAAAARRTPARSGVSSAVTVGVLRRAPTEDTIAFYVHRDLWASSLERAASATEIVVPVLAISREIAEHQASYLIVDIEGAETEILGDLPTCVRKVCVECHPRVSRPADLRAMLIALLTQDFVLSMEQSRAPVLYFER